MRAGYQAWIGALILSVVPSVRPSVQAQQRDFVLRQVKVPHNYYWREMYVPQVTGGPESATWSPDGSELIYAMQGSLWRQRIGSDTARQLTDGPGYDHQPDWSPDGRYVVYSSYQKDALQLRLLDLRTGADRALIDDGNVHLDARWSPEGDRIAFVSTIYQGRWHVFMTTFGGGTIGMPQRITEDKNSGLPRYYYSVWDHFLSPTWGPNGELILVSNRGRLMGTGGFWRTASRPFAPMRELWYEETTWKARPDWARDGKRVVYSGYHGRQWNQLWLMTSEGGDPFQLTYGDFDATNPRWAPDGRRIAFISNETEGRKDGRTDGSGRSDGPSFPPSVIPSTSLWVLDVPGGRRTPILPAVRRWVRPQTTVTIAVSDSSGRPLSSRISVFDSTGKSYSPDAAWRHADEAFVRGEQQFEYGYFHADGTATVSLPPGRYTIETWKGPEWSVGRAEVTVANGAVARRAIRMHRIMDLPRAGWWGGDVHVHMNYGGHYRNTPVNLKRQAQAEGLHVVENLIVNKEQRIPDIAYWQPGVDSVSGRDFVLAHAEEYHTSYWGHSALLGLKDYFVLPNYVAYANTAAASLWPMNADVFDIARSQGALTGYVHPFDTKPDPFNKNEAIRYEMPIDVALGKLDYFEVMGYSDHLITSEFWYRLLNCGFRIPAAAGTDAFPNFASLRGPPGLVRTYARTDGQLEHRRWLDALRSGRTFVTNSAILGVGWKVDGRTEGRNDGQWRGIGDSVALTGASSIAVRVTMRSNTPVDHLELVGNGRVLASIGLRGDRTRADTVVTVPVENSSWFIVRAWADRPRLPVLDLYPFASSSPFYVTVSGRPIRSEEDADYFITWIDRVREEMEKHAGWNTPDERAAVMRRIDLARTEFLRRKDGRTE